MAKKKRGPNPNPNLNFSQASKKDEGNRILESVSFRGEEELCASKASTPTPGNLATTSSPKLDGGVSSFTTPVSAGAVTITDLAGGSISRGYCSSSPTPDLTGSNGEATSTSWNFEDEGASFVPSPPSEVAGAAVVQAGIKKQSRLHCSKTLATAHGNGGSSISTLDSSMNLSKIAINSKGNKLGFLSPIFKDGKKVVQLQSSDLVVETEKWKFALVFYVIGIKPSYNAVRNFVNHHWGKLADSSIFFHNDGYFILRFKTNVINEIVCNGPYAFAGKPVVAKQWNVGFDFQAEVNRCVPVWVRFPNLPLPCWSENSLSRLGSALGVPLCSDRSTSQQLRISYARVLIEIDVTKPLETTIMVEGGHGVAFEQKVIYEWVPHFCSKCYQVGHNCEHKLVAPKKKKKKGKKMWAPKKKLEEVEQRGENAVQVVDNGQLLGDDLATVGSSSIDAATPTTHGSKAASAQQQKGVGRSGQQQGTDLLLVRAAPMGQQGNEGDAGQQQHSQQSSPPIIVLSSTHNGPAAAPLTQQQQQLMQQTPRQQEHGDDDETGKTSETSTSLEPPSYLNITTRKHRGKWIPP